MLPPFRCAMAPYTVLGSMVLDEAQKHSNAHTERCLYDTGFRCDETAVSNERIKQMLNGFSDGHAWEGKAQDQNRALDIAENRALESVQCHTHNCHQTVLNKYRARTSLEVDLLPPLCALRRRKTVARPHWPRPYQARRSETTP
jgi:hypothetical protein